MCVISVGSHVDNNQMAVQFHGQNARVNGVKMVCAKEKQNNNREQYLLIDAFIL